MNDNVNNVENQAVTPAALLIEENKKIRAELEELKKEVAEYKAFAVASTRRVITNDEGRKENSDDKLQEIVKEYKGRYERWH